jgi:hypothetical protein
LRAHHNIEWNSAQHYHKEFCWRSKILLNPASKIQDRTVVAAEHHLACSRSSFARLTAILSMLAGLVGINGCGGEVPAPTAFVAYNSPDGRFSCDYPKGWEASGGGKAESPMSWAKFTSGNAEIRVDTDLAGSLHADIAKSGAAMSGDAEPPVAKIHPMGIRHMKDEYGNYEERDAKSFKSKGFGEGRKAIFIASGGLGGKTFGYRATLLSGDRRITIITACPATNWQILKPAFDKVVESLRTGGG